MHQTQLERGVSGNVHLPKLTRELVHMTEGCVDEDSYRMYGVFVSPLFQLSLNVQKVYMDLPMIFKYLGEDCKGILGPNSYHFSRSLFFPSPLSPRQTCAPLNRNS